jgi:AcrR family transcriptional regulator
METKKRSRLSREDWLQETFKVLQNRGVDGVKIVVIAERLGVTSGSFYWHFKNLQDLLGCLLEHWERELTDAVIDLARDFSGPPRDRILHLMLQVIDQDAAAYDPAISVWAKNDPSAKKVFGRTLRKRFDFARWMFKQSGFSDKQAGIRGRLMVAYLMGETAADLKSDKNWKASIRGKHKILTTRNDRSSETRN